jgi:hypothetical protein
MKQGLTEKLAVAQSFTNFTIFCETTRFITVLATAI